MISDGGKGSKSRPFSISDEEYANRWDMIFAKARRERALDELAKINEELGLSYEDTYNPLIKE
jgi:hypothetical protein